MQVCSIHVLTVGFKFSKSTFQIGLFPLLFLNCPLVARCTLFRLSTLIYLGPMYPYSLTHVFDQQVLNIQLPMCLRRPVVSSSTLTVRPAISFSNTKNNHTKFYELLFYSYSCRSGVRKYLVLFAIHRRCF
jgi:hypothetical protein